MKGPLQRKTKKKRGVSSEDYKKKGMGKRRRVGEGAGDQKAINGGKKT